MVFLPFSSWLVSLTGNSQVSLFRDFFILFFLLVAIVSFKYKNIKTISIFALLLLLYAVCSYFWRETSPAQWLRGLRFFVMPIILFLALAFTNLPIKNKKLIYSSICLISLLIVALSIFEYFNLIPLYREYNAVGALNNINYIGQIFVRRLQSVLQGPNAFGLYLLAVISFYLGSFNLVNKKLRYLAPVFIIFLFLTFSRSSSIGLLVLLIIWGFYYLKGKYNLKKTIVISLASLLLLFIALGYIASKPAYQDYFLHGDSSSMRIEQMQRIWQERGEIGLFGRGLGTAGPSSVNRLDGGPNHWTENIYLDIFEELGLIGIAIYLAFIIYLLVILKRKSDNIEGRTAFFALLSFSVTGLFINYYTGQVGLYLVWLACGLALNSSESKYGKNIN